MSIPQGGIRQSATLVPRVLRSLTRVSEALLYVASRFALVAVTFIFIITLLFTMVHLAPGDPLTYRYQTGTALSDEVYDELRAKYGLDKSIIHQYFIYVGDLVQGDLGQSIRFNQSVSRIILDRLVATLILMISGIVIGLLVGTFLGISSARDPNSFKDNALRVIMLVGYSVPPFWLGIILLLTFSVNLGIFPAASMVDPRIASGTWAYYLSIAWHAVLPVFTLSLFYIALFARYSRTSMLEQSTENYVITARAKGLDRKRTFSRHVMKNGLLPVMTMVGVSLTYLFGGAVLVETVFSWPGIGRLTYDSLLARDYALVQGIFICIATTVIIVTFLVNIAYGMLDPRIREGR